MCNFFIFPGGGGGEWVIFKNTVSLIIWMGKLEYRELHQNAKILRTTCNGSVV